MSKERCRQCSQRASQESNSDEGDDSDDEHGPVLVPLRAELILPQLCDHGQAFHGTTNDPVKVLTGWGCPD
jgi:hypothetical protein